MGNLCCAPDPAVVQEANRVLLLRPTGAGAAEGQGGAGAAAPEAALAAAAAKGRKAKRSASPPPRKQSVGCAADIWALACVVFELLTGAYLFDVERRDKRQFGRDEFHLVRMVELLGPLPQNMVRGRAGIKVGRYFKDGTFIHDVAEGRFSIAELLRGRGCDRRRRPASSSSSCWFTTRRAAPVRKTSSATSGFSSATSSPPTRPRTRPRTRSRTRPRTCPRTCPRTRTWTPPEDL